MTEAVATPHPRIALVCGAASGVAPLRAALAPAAEVVYADHAAAFDVDRARALGVAAVLVSVDGGDWLEPLADRADASRIRLVFDDPAISGTLDGWGRARWLRHLAAKLAGSSDYDPPRPPDAKVPADPAGCDAPVARSEVADEVAARLSPMTGVASLAARFVGAPDVAAVVGRSRDMAAVAATGTAAFAGVVGGGAGESECERVGYAVAAPAAIALALCKEGDMVEVRGTTEDAGSGGEPRAALAGASVIGGEGAAANTAAPDPAVPDPGESLELDPDTAALSALIDSQLAEPAVAAANGAAGVWRVPPAGNTGSADVDLPAGTVTTVPAAGADGRRRVHPVSDPVEESEVLKGLPSVDDWQLVDPGAPAAAAATVVKGLAASVSIDIAGLELVPMEEAVTNDRHSDPIERWMDTAERVTATAHAARPPRPRKDRSDA